GRRGRGNVRERRTAWEHAAMGARGEPRRPEHSPRLAGEPSAASPAEQLAAAVRRWAADRARVNGGPPADLYGELLRCVEPALLEEVMRRVQDNRWGAARWLRRYPATGRQQLERYHLT